MHLSKKKKIYMHEIQSFYSKNFSSIAMGAHLIQELTCAEYISGDFG